MDNFETDVHCWGEMQQVYILLHNNQVNYSIKEWAWRSIVRTNEGEDR